MGVLGRSGRLKWDAAETQRWSRQEDITILRGGPEPDAGSVAGASSGNYSGCGALHILLWRRAGQYQDEQDAIQSRGRNPDPDFPHPLLLYQYPLHQRDSPPHPDKGSSALGSTLKTEQARRQTDPRADRQWPGPMLALLQLSAICFNCSSISKYLGCPNWSSLLLDTWFIFTFSRYNTHREG